MKKIIRIAIAGASLLLAGAGIYAAWPDALEPYAATGPRLMARQVLVLPDADGPERDAEFSPDGNLLATAAASGAVQIRRSGSWQLLASLPHPAGVTAIAFTPDGERIVSVSYDGIVRLWDLRTRSLVRATRASDRTIWTLDISPDGSQLATAGDDAIVRLWAVRSGRLLRELRGHRRTVWQIRFSPDGATLATASFDRMIHIWGMDGALIRSLAGHEQAVVGLAFSPDGRWLASSGDDSKLRIWRASDGALRQTLRSGNHTYRVVFSRDGEWLATAGRGRTAALTFWHELTGLGGNAEAIRLWRAADGALVQSLDLRHDALSAPAISPDLRWMVTGDETSAVTIWQLSRSR